MLNKGKKSISVMTLCILLFVVGLSFLNYINNYINLGLREREAVTDFEEYFSGVLEERKFNFWINDQGNTGNIFYTPKRRDIKIRLTYNTDGLPIDPSRVEIKINGINGKNKLLPISFSKAGISNFDYSADYKGESIGSDEVEVAISGSPIKYTGKINFYDNSFVVESDIGAEQINFKTGSSLRIDKKSVEPPKFIDSFVENFFDGVEVPGKVAYSLTPDTGNEINKKATLDVYTLASSIREMYSSNFISKYQPVYLSNLKNLDNVLKENPQNISAQIMPDFPPTNASRGGTFDIKIINFKGGKGVRFLIPGYFQAFDPAEHSTYVFQGITDDGMHHVVFRYNNIFSPDLERELKNKPSSMDNEKMKSWIMKTFVTAKSQNEEKFIPKLSTLDSFLESLEINSK